MIAPNKKYPAQMNGPIISAFGQGIDEEFSKGDVIADYLYNLSIETAQETELETIGRIVGYPRPLVPNGFNSENLLLLGTLPLATDQTNGLAAAGTEVGGQLSTLSDSDSNYMDLNTYRKFLEKMAYLKRYGLTLQSVSKIASIVDKDFEISWDENKDIVVTFNNPIGYKNIWILTKIFYKIATEPQVIIQAGQED